MFLMEDDKNVELLYFLKVGEGEGMSVKAGNSQFRSWMCKVKAENM